MFQKLEDNTGAEFVVELIDTFIAEAPALLNELEQTRGGASAERFRRATHSLECNGQTFGAVRLATLTHPLERGGMVSDAAVIVALRCESDRAAAARMKLGPG